MVELAPFLGFEEEHRSPFGPVDRIGAILNELVLIGRYWPGDLPEGSAGRAVGIDRIARPVPAWIEQIELAGIGHRGDFVAKLAGQEAGHRVFATMISRTTMQQEDTDLFAVSAGRGIRRIFGL